MEQPSEIICYIRFGGELVRVGDVNVEYKGGVRDVKPNEHGMQYEEFIATTCQTLNNITQENLLFTLTALYKYH